MDGGLLVLPGPDGFPVLLGSPPGPLPPDLPLDIAVRFKGQRLLIARFSAAAFSGSSPNDSIQHLNEVVLFPDNVHHVRTVEATGQLAVDNLDQQIQIARI